MLNNIHRPLACACRVPPALFFPLVSRYWASAASVALCFGVAEARQRLCRPPVVAASTGAGDSSSPGPLKKSSQGAAAARMPQAAVDSQPGREVHDVHRARGQRPGVGSASGSPGGSPVGAPPGSPAGLLQVRTGPGTGMAVGSPSTSSTSGTTPGLQAASGPGSATGASAMPGHPQTGSVTPSSAAHVEALAAGKVYAPQARSMLSPGHVRHQQSPTK